MIMLPTDHFPMNDSQPALLQGCFTGHDFKNTLKEGTPIEACWEEVGQDKGIKLASVIRSRTSRNKDRGCNVWLWENRHLMTHFCSTAWDMSWRMGKTGEFRGSCQVFLSWTQWSLWETATTGPHYRLFSLSNNLLIFSSSILLIVWSAAQENSGKCPSPPPLSLCIPQRK